MNYIVEFKEQEIELKKYNISIAERIEKTEKIAYSEKTYKDKCKAMYDFLEEIIDKNIISDIIGKFNDCDPNDVNLLYMRVVRSYNKPIFDYEREQEEEQLEKAKDLLEELNKAPASVKKLQEVKSK